VTGVKRQGTPTTELEVSPDGLRDSVAGGHQEPGAGRGSELVVVGVADSRRMAGTRKRGERDSRGCFALVAGSFAEGEVAVVVAVEAEEGTWPDGGDRRSNSSRTSSPCRRPGTGVG
jgi:hypothetical protein